MQESRALTRKSASNLALAFVLLPKAKRDGMSALYAFCRAVDDIADELSIPLPERRAQLAAWRAQIKLACTDGVPQFPIARELQPIIRQYGLAFDLFDALLLGVEMDLDINRYQDYEQLELYCYRVASVVGLLSIEIFGYSNPACRDYAIYLGKALQLTNILRDVRTDAQRGRIYLPLGELARFEVAQEEILRLEYSQRYVRLAASVAGRASQFYQLAHRTLPVTDRRSMIAAELMGSVYWRLLEKLQSCAFNVFGDKPIGLNRAQKLLLILRTWLRFTVGGLRPNYGNNNAPEGRRPRLGTDSIQQTAANPAFPADENQRR